MNHFVAGVRLRTSKLTINPGVVDDDDDVDSEEDFRQDEPIGKIFSKC